MENVPVTFLVPWRVGSAPGLIFNIATMNTISKIICAAAMAVVTMSCSIKEDRMPCPGRLEIGLDACVSLTGGVHLDGWNDGGTLFDKRVDLSRDMGNAAEFSVPKGTFSYCAWFGLSDLKNDVKQRCYSIPFGKECDPLYVSSAAELVMAGEYLRDEVVPHRQHCVMTLVVTGLPQDRMRDLLIGVSSSTAGMRLDDLSPVQGEFLAIRYPDESGYLSFTLPRQGFGDLRANLYDNGRVAASYDLTALLDSLGYDWTADDLQDITLEFSVSSASASIIMGPWEDGGSLTPTA